MITDRPAGALSWPWEEFSGLQNEVVSLRRDRQMERVKTETHLMLLKEEEQAEKSGCM